MLNHSKIIQQQNINLQQNSESITNPPSSIPSTATPSAPSSTPSSAAAPFSSLPTSSSGKLKDSHENDKMDRISKRKSAAVKTPKIENKKEKKRKSVGSIKRKSGLDASSDEDEAPSNLKPIGSDTSGKMESQSSHSRLPSSAISLPLESSLNHSQMIKIEHCRRAILLATSVGIRITKIDYVVKIKEKATTKDGNTKGITDSAAKAKLRADRMKKKKKI